jgi:hypothetical protein
VSNKHDVQNIYHCPPCPPKKDDKPKSDPVAQAMILVLVVFFGAPVASIAIKISVSFWAEMLCHTHRCW